jgi:hypothetical protein
MYINYSWKYRFEELYYMDYRGVFLDEQLVRKLALFRTQTMRYCSYIKTCFKTLSIVVVGNTPNLWSVSSMMTI